MIVGRDVSESVPLRKFPREAAGEGGHIGCPAAPSWSVMWSMSFRAARVRADVMRGLSQSNLASRASSSRVGGGRQCDVSDWWMAWVSAGQIAAKC